MSQNAEEIYAEARRVRHRPDESLPLYLRAVELAEKEGKHFLLAEALMMCAWNHFGQRRFEDAAAFFERRIALQFRSEDPLERRVAKEMLEEIRSGRAQRE